MIQPLRPRFALLVLLSVTAAAQAQDRSRPPREPSPRDRSPPDLGEPVTHLKLRGNDLEIALRDNAASPRTLSGIQSLFHRKVQTRFDAYDPDTAGASAGMNFEHIISGHPSVSNSFTPRKGRYTLRPWAVGSGATLTRDRKDSPWDVSSQLSYSLGAPNAIDIEFRCKPHSPERFGKRRYAVFFFANYMNDVADHALHFRGVEKEGAKEKWIRADTPAGHPDWNTGGTFRHRDASALEYDEDHNFKLNSWSYEWPRYTQPFYYGRAAHDMVWIILFDRSHSRLDEIRFSLFKFKLGKHPRPAWDFQYVVHDTHAKGDYGFRARVIWKKWVSAEDCLDEYRRWKPSQRHE